MAVNLRKKIGQDRKLVVCDQSKEAVERFRAQTQDLGQVEVAANGFEAAKAAVRRFLRFRSFNTDLIHRTPC